MCTGPNVLLLFSFAQSLSKAFTLSSFLITNAVFSTNATYLVASGKNHTGDSTPPYHGGATKRCQREGTYIERERERERGDLI